MVGLKVSKCSNFIFFLKYQKPVVLEFCVNLKTPWINVVKSSLENITMLCPFGGFHCLFLHVRQENTYLSATPIMLDPENKKHTKKQR